MRWSVGLPIKQEGRRGQQLSSQGEAQLPTQYRLTMVPISRTFQALLHPNLSYTEIGGILQCAFKAG